MAIEFTQRELRWLEKNRPVERISGQYIYLVPNHVYEKVGGLKELDEHPRNEVDI